MKRNTEVHSFNHWRRGKAMSIISSTLVSVAIAKQQSERMCRIQLQSVACLAVQFFPYINS